MPVNQQLQLMLYRLRILVPLAKVLAQQDVLVLQAPNVATQHAQMGALPLKPLDVMEPLSNAQPPNIPIILENVRTVMRTV